MPRRPRERGLSNEALDLIAARFRVLGEPNRLRLIHALEHGESSVTGLVTATGLTQANVSRHLQALIQAGILGRRKVGLNVIYFIADPEIFDLCTHVCGSVQKRLDAHSKAFGG